MSGVEVLRPLQAQAPEVAFTDKHVRTIQRALEKWRSQAVRSLIDRMNQEQVGPTDLASPADESSGNILR